MLRKNKLALSVALSVGVLSLVANAAMPDLTYDGAVVNDGDTIKETSPTFLFKYDAAMSGVLVDLTEGLDADDKAVGDDTANVAKCGSVSETAYLALSDMNCSAAGCEWIPSTVLKNGSSYYLNYQQVKSGGIDLMEARDAAGGDPAVGCDENQEGVVFKVDTTNTSAPVPTAPPEQVVITTNPGDKCTAGGATVCTIEFKHANEPAASHYRVWINDKNGIQIDEDALSAKADLSTDLNGWFEIATSAPTSTQAGVSCTPQLDGSRECKLEIGPGHPVYANMTAGKKLKIWVRAWNVKGYAAWSDSVEFDMD
jgi:hypothetical protein